MLKELGVKWKTALALLIAVATALLFSTATPMTPAPQSQGEAVCAPEQHDIPCISKQESGNPTAPRAENDVGIDPRLGDLIVKLLAANIWTLPLQDSSDRTRHAGGVYARGPPTLA